MIPIDRQSRVPLGDQIVDQFSHRIASGQLVNGLRLPSIRQLASRLGVSAYTVVNAYDRLIALGVIEVRAGSGFYVKRQRDQQTPTELALNSGGDVDVLWLARRILQAGPGQIPAGSAFVPAHWVEDVLSPAFVAKALRARPASVTAQPQGLPELREQLALKLNSAGIAADPASILVTFGASHAIDLIVRTLTEPGDAVLVEDPVYYVLLDHLREAGVKIIPVPRTPDGPDLEALEAACREHHPKLFFIQPLLHNPTGWSATPASLHRVLEMAERFDFLLAEDDIYADMHPGNPVRLAQLAGLNRVIHYSSFTKVVNPAWRVGYLAATPRLIELMTAEKIRSVLTGSMVEETVLAELLRSGRYRKHLQTLRTKLAAARPRATQLLNSVGLRVVDPADCGIFLWAEMPPGINVDALVRDAFDAGILLAKGQLFFASDAPSAHLRFNVATCTDARVIEFLQSRLQAAPDNVVALPSRHAL
ncbi:MAG TPA: PLP-dependent aminotransferase family protein [Pseudomonadales bacterium]|nr:PLP-dependent aminotransferase family protein [Pseudomonadales bacterium]